MVTRARVLCLPLFQQPRCYLWLSTKQIQATNRDVPINFPFGGGHFDYLTISPITVVINQEGHRKQYDK